MDAHVPILPDGDQTTNIMTDFFHLLAWQLDYM